MRSNCFIDTKLTMQLLFPSSHWLFRVLQHFHGSYLKYSFFLAQRTEKCNLFSKHHTTDFDAVCHPSPMISSRCWPPPANNKNYPSCTARVRSFASYGNNYNTVVYCPASQCQEKKQPTKRANSGFYQKQFVNHFLESFCFSRSDVVHFVSFVERNSGLLQLVSSDSNLLVLL